MVALPVACLAGLPDAEGNGIVAAIGKVVTIVTDVGLALIVLMVVYAGILFLTSSGDPGKVGTAKACLLYAVIGGILIAVAKTIETVIKTIQ